MMHRYFIYLSYIGKNYHGWQIQPNGIAVQEVLVTALETILRYEVTIVGAGRTDTGVHAKRMVAHVDTIAPLENTTDFVYKLNSLLPNDVAVDKVVSVKLNAHARFDAISRTYEYWVVPNKNPFLHDYATRIFFELDYPAMHKAAQQLLNYTDFTSFSKLHTQVKTNNCTIQEARWEQRGYVWVFTIKADRFLRNMVRAIVGTLFKVGRGELSEADFVDIIESKNRKNAGMSAPAEGLYLVDVSYPKEIFNYK